MRLSTASVPLQFWGRLSVSALQATSRGLAAYDYLVVGAGFAGAVIAERLAADLDKRVLLIERRSHLGGSAHDGFDEAGILIHRYGPHIFHTNSEQIVDYLSRFTNWRRYEHRVLVEVDSMLLPMPINRTTLNQFFKIDLRTDAEAAAFLAARAVPTDEIRTSKDVIVSSIGLELYEKFFRGYTLKQWGVEASELDKFVTSRLPTRTDLDDRYFLDDFQGLPAAGYTRMFERMLDHDNISIQLGVDYADIVREYNFAHVVYTGAIDAFYQYRFGKLPYRSVRFLHETYDQPRRQPNGVINYPSLSLPYTRITEHKCLTGQSHPRTTITYEYPQAEGDPFYPVLTPESIALCKRYQALAAEETRVDFIGRLGTFRYYNMDQVVGQALAMARRLKARQSLAAQLNSVCQV
jgi:UDP-galactopyranose mutase